MRPARAQLHSELLATFETDGAGDLGAEDAARLAGGLLRHREVERTGAVLGKARLIHRGALEAREGVTVNAAGPSMAIW